MTHRPADNVQVFKTFVQALAPLIEARKLACILLQFPYSFRFNHPNWDYLAQFPERLGGLPAVIEFRNAQWLRREVFDWMRKNDLGFCCVDEPRLPNLLPPVAEVTGRLGYVRFHGCNREKWWEHEHAYERYDYTYTPEELSEWLPKIKKIKSETENTFIFANNHWRGQSIGTIRQLRKMLD